MKTLKYRTRMDPHNTMKRGFPLNPTGVLLVTFEDASELMRANVPADGRSRFVRLAANVASERFHLKDRTPFVLRWNSLTESQQ